MDSPEQYANKLIELIKSIVDNPERAQEYLNDREGVLDGLGEPNLAGVDLHGVVSSACAGLPPAIRAEVQSLTSGVGSSGGLAAPAALGAVAPSGVSAPPPPPAVAPVDVPPLQTVIQTVDYVTYVTYRDNQEIVQNFVDSSVDNSQTANINVDPGFEGIIDVDQENNSVNATGDRAVAAGRDANAATGDGSTAVGGDNRGTIQSNSGDGAVQAGEDISAPVNTGTNRGIMADGDVENAILNSGAGDVQATQIDGNVSDSAIGGFGSGDTTNVGDLHDSTAVIGDANQTTTLNDTEVDDGSAVGGSGGSAAGANVDIEDSFNEATQVQAQDSVVGTEQGSGAGQVEVEESDVGDDDFDAFN